jgi:CBS domain-containing protein
MATLNDILQRKPDRPLLSSRPEEHVLQATQRMNEHKVGALLVMDGPQLVGIFTERDVLRRVVAEERPPATVRVEEVMTRDIAIATPETTVDDAAGIMRQRRIRHLPIVNASGAVQGLVSIGDLNAFHASTQEVTIHYLHEYLHGRS